jgi:type IV pilus assembly protein PilM
MSFLDSLGSIFSKKAQSVLGIDIGASAIKVVEIKKKHGRAVLKTYGELALGPYAGTEVGRATNLPPAKLAEALRDILREAKTTSTLCGSALPLSSSLISFITIPPVAEKQMAEVVSLEARKYIPVQMNEVLLDWSPIPREGNYPSEDDGAEDKKTTTTTAVGADANQKKNIGGQDILVVAIHNEYIAKYQDIMSSSGLSPTFYEIEVFGAIRASIEQGIQTMMILDMGAQATKLYIIERGILRASHIINKGSQDITLAISKSLSLTIESAENMKRVYGLSSGSEHKDLHEIITVNLDYIFYEANTVLSNYQKKSNRNVAKIILTGGGVLLKGFTDLAKISFQTEIVYANPFDKMETPAIFTEQLKLAGPEFAVAIGIALRRLSELR